MKQKINRNVEILRQIFSADESDNKNGNEIIYQDVLNLMHTTTDKLPREKVYSIIDELDEVLRDEVKTLEYVYDHRNELLDNKSLEYNTLKAMCLKLSGRANMLDSVAGASEWSDKKDFEKFSYDLYNRMLKAMNPKMQKAITQYGDERNHPFSEEDDEDDTYKSIDITGSYRRNNMIKSSNETLYEDDGGRFYTWSELKADIDDFVKTSDFKDQFEGDEDMFEYFEKDHKTPKYYKIYMDFWDISSNGAMSEVEGTEEQWNEYNEQHGITSAKENNMKTPIKSGYTGTNVTVEYGPYGEEKDFPFYDMKGETVEQIDETIGYYDEKGAHWGTDGNSYVILEDRAYSEDKIAVLEDDYDEWVESMNNEDYSKLLSNSRKAIKSASGSWEYQSDDMDEVEKKIGDIGISFTEPLLLADDGTLYTRAGFDQWLKYLEREEGDNWPDAYESYHRDTDEEFIEMCQDDFFQHDFGYTLTIYPEGLKSIAESVAEEIPSNEAPFAIPSGFAFNLYAEEEEPSGFNSYWIDDMSLDSESFIWGINPKLGNRFDVAINPDYLWNGTENIQSSKKGEKKMKIQSKRLIKSGTSNFGSNDDIFGYSFPLVTYVAENYYYDEETDSETEERDYDADDWEYRDAIEDAKALADEMNIPQYDDYSEPYLCYEPFMIKFRDGYYEGLWIEVKEGTDETNYDSDGEYTGEWVPFTEEQMNKYADKLNEYFNKLCSDYGWQKLGVTARFSNGETMYHKIDNSRKPVTSGLTFRQAVQDFKAAGQWNDYYEMQQDWESYKDGLERDGVISEKTRSTWGNPCTLESFKKWNK